MRRWLDWKSLTGWDALAGHLLRRRHFTSQVLQDLAAHIAQSEHTHTGELMLVIEAVSPVHEPDSHQRALEVFGKCRVWDTAHNSGVLLYLALDKHQIELIADRGVAAPDTVWQAVCEQLRQDLSQGRYREGVMAAVDAIEDACRQYCPPLRGESTDELPNRPVLL